MYNQHREREREREVYDVKLTSHSQLKRQRSVELEGATPPDQKSPGLFAFTATAPSPPTSTGQGGLGSIPGLGGVPALGKSLPDDTAVGSPLKKQRPSHVDVGAGQPNPPSGLGAKPQVSTSAPAAASTISTKMDDDEEEEL